MDEKPARRREDVGVQPWAKLALTVVGTTVTTLVAMFLWVSSTFVSRTEWQSHSTQQSLDIERILTVQKTYADQERRTAGELALMNAKLGVIEARQLMVLERLGPTRGK